MATLELGPQTSLVFDGASPYDGELREIRYNGGSVDVDFDSQITKREASTLALIGVGKTLVEAAQVLYISTSTAKGDISRVRHMLETKTSAETVHAAFGLEFFSVRNAIRPTKLLSHIQRYQLERLADGDSMQAIATDTNRSLPTVKAHSTTMLQNLGGVPNVTAAVTAGHLTKQLTADRTRTFKPLPPTCPAERLQMTLVERGVAQLSPVELRRMVHKIAGRRSTITQRA